MGFIESELQKIAEALRKPCSEDEYRRLYDIQAALAWAMDPRCFQSQFSYIRGMEEGSEDYQGYHGPVQSLCNDSHAGLSR